MFRRLETHRHIENEQVTASRKFIYGSFPTHWHEFYELEYILSGSGTYEVDGQAYPLRSGMLFFMTPVSFHRVSVEKAEVFNVMFAGSMCAPTHLAALSATPYCTVQVQSSHDRRYFEALLTELAEQQDDTAYSSLLLDNITAKISKSLSRSTPNELSLSGRVIFYILNNFRSRLTLEDAAAYTGFSPAYLSERFKQETGINFKEYLNNLRYDYAKNLLCYSDLSITQVCSESGFDDYANFIRRFHTRFGTSPGRYRKEALSARTDAR